MTTEELFEKKVSVSVSEFCSITGISQPTARRRIKDGTIPVIRYGGRVLISTTYLKKIFCEGAE